MDIKGASEVAKASENIVQRKRDTWMPIYYDCKAKAVITEKQYEALEDKEWAWKLTELIRPCTKEEVESTVVRFLNM